MNPKLLAASESNLYAYRAFERVHAVWVRRTAVDQDKTLEGSVSI